ncbi:unnamed protein product [Notodromas monacha]|uniref:oxaloacetate tautomerase n=1 Tax=Notodromas monacha TaxID=399045 RepID=A0A7R9GHX2_9CRUS|nr:unnamed protein product [Notodromas monacha]CAG0921229.1 unnamed protein product [Notodromas monacha]
MANAANIQNFVKFGRKIVCIGRNYKDHIAEMKAALPTKPVVFIKPATSYIQQGHSIVIPPECDDLHHEVELGVVIGSLARNVEQSSAMSFVAGYCLALDMTARDLQQDCKTKGLPWEIAKGFDTSCPIGEFIPAEKISDPHDLDLWSVY